MAAVPQVTKSGPRTYVPVEVIIGGQLVEARAAGKVGVAGANSVRVLGVALMDAVPEGLQTGEAAADGFGILTVNATPLPTRVPVAYGPDEVPVKYSANAAFGDPLVATAAGTVAPAGATPDARQIVGRCTEPAGVAAGAVGLTRLA